MNFHYDQKGILENTMVLRFCHRNSSTPSPHRQIHFLKIPTGHFRTSLRPPYSSVCVKPSKQVQDAMSRILFLETKFAGKFRLSRFRIIAINRINRKYELSLICYIKIYLLIRCRFLKCWSGLHSVRYIQVKNKII